MVNLDRDGFSSLSRLSPTGGNKEIKNPFIGWQKLNNFWFIDNKIPDNNKIENIKSFLFKIFKIFN